MNEKMETHNANKFAIRSPRMAAYILINITPKINSPPANIGKLPSKTLLTTNSGVASVINDKNSDNNVVAYFKMFSPLLNNKMNRIFINKIALNKNNICLAI